MTLLDKKRPLVIFDLDGTLYNAAGPLVAAIERACSELGLVPPGRDELLSRVGETGDNFFSGLWPDLDDAKRAAFRERAWGHEEALVEEMGKSYAGVPELLRSLSERGCEIAICSNGGRSYIDKVLKACQLAQFINHISAKEDGADKTTRIATMLADLDPSWVVVVGDRYHDIEAARSNGIPSVGVTYGFGGDEVKKADFTVDAPNEIESIVAQCDIFAQIERDLISNKNDRALIVGIDGIDSSGKSAFSKSLARFLKVRRYPVQLIHLDDFHNPKELRATGPNPVEAYIENAFNIDLLITKLLQPAHAQKAIETQLTLLDLETDQFSISQRFSIDRRTVVIVEGVLLYREPLNSFFDYRVYLDISFDEMLRRAEKRDVPQHGLEFLEKYRSKYIPIQEWYITTHNPIARSDIVIDNTNYCRPTLLRLK